MKKIIFLVFMIMLSACGSGSDEPEQLFVSDYSNEPAKALNTDLQRIYDNKLFLYDFNKSAISSVSIKKNDEEKCFIDYKDKENKFSYLDVSDCNLENGETYDVLLNIGGQEFKFNLLAETRSFEKVKSFIVKGKFIDALTGEGFNELPSCCGSRDIITDDDGSFKFKVDTTDFANSEHFYFYHEDYGSFGFSFIKDQAYNKDGFDVTYDLAYYFHENLGNEPIVMHDGSGKQEIDLGNITIYPKADLIIKSDRDITFKVYRFPINTSAEIDQESMTWGSNVNTGAGPHGFVDNYYFEDLFVLDYNHFIVIEDTSGNKYMSEPVTMPKEMEEQTVFIYFYNNNIEWDY